MSQTTIARRYAQALYQEAEAAGKVDQVDRDIEAVRDSIEASRELARLFASRAIPSQKKQEVLEAIFEGKVDERVLGLVRLLVEKGREALIPDVVRAYAQLRDERLGLVEASVRTALPLGPDEADALKSALEHTTGRKVRLRIEVDPALIGGLIVRVGDTVYDGSARHHLERLREDFATGIYFSN